MNTILEDKIALLPEKPGVYKMLDESGTVIYVGKAKILKKLKTIIYLIHNLQSQNLQKVEYDEKKIIK